MHFANDYVSKIEKSLGRTAVDSHRTKPDRKDLAWKQIGVLGTLKDKQPLYFIEWISLVLALTDRKAIIKIVIVNIAGGESHIEEWLGSKLRAIKGLNVKVEWAVAEANESKFGIIAEHVMTPSSVVRLD